ncbi:UNVERIFIED_CONTAM: methyl-accepting chemotaxis protein [Brevibacillus sp. OAP136]
MKKRLQLQILIPFLALILLSVAVVSVVSYVVSVNTTMEVLTQNIGQRMEQTDKTFDLYFKKTENIVSMLAKADEFANYETQHGQLMNTLEAFEDSGAYFGTEKGEYFSTGAWQDVPKDFDPRKRVWYQKAVQHKGEIIWTDPYADASDPKSMTITAAEAIYKGEQLVGVVAIDVAPTELIDLAKDIKIGDTGHAILLDANGIVLYHPDQAAIGTDMSKEDTYRQMQAKGAVGDLQIDVNDDIFTMSYVTNEVTGWKLIGTVKVNELASRAGVIFNPLLITCLILLAIATLISILLARRITKPIQRLGQSIEEVEKGNLGIVMTTNREDEIGQLTRRVNKMVEQNREIIGKIQEYAQHAADSAESLSTNINVNNDIAGQIHESMAQVAAGAHQQQKQTEEGMRALEEMSVGLQRFAETASIVSEATVETANKAEQGDKSIRQAVAEMDAINQSVTLAADTVEQLGKRSQQIEEIVVAITAISSQTNLLSLNAAIEAARAGEHGKGFAVVEGEVRKLAEQSAESAKRIEQLIKEIQNETSHAISSMDVVSSNASAGMEAVKRSGEMFRVILQQIKQVSDQIQSASAISEEMSASSEEILAAVDETAKIAQLSSGKAGEVASSIEEQVKSLDQLAGSGESLNKMAHELKRLTDRYTV